MREIVVGKTYKHFKGHFYRVLCMALHTETQELMVIYQSLDQSQNVYARPYELFVSKVDKEKYPLVEQTYRFEAV